MPAICRRLTTSPSSRNDHTTASAGCATWAIPIVPIWIVFCANTIRPWAATPLMSARISMYVQPVPLSPNTSPLAIASGSTATAAIGQIVAMNVATSMSRRKCRVDDDVADQQQHRDHAEDVALAATRRRSAAR